MSSGARDGGKAGDVPSRRNASKVNDRPHSRQDRRSPAPRPNRIRPRSRSSSEKSRGGTKGCERDGRWPGDHCTNRISKAQRSSSRKEKRRDGRTGSVMNFLASPASTSQSSSSFSAGVSSFFSLTRSSRRLLFVASPIPPTSFSSSSRIKMGARQSASICRLSSTAVAALGSSSKNAMGGGGDAEVEGREVGGAWPVRCWRRGSGKERI